MDNKLLSIIGIALLVLSLGSMACSKKDCNHAKGQAQYFIDGSGGTKAAECIKEKAGKEFWDKVESIAKDPGGDNETCKGNLKLICETVKPHTEACDLIGWYESHCK